MVFTEHVGTLKGSNKVSGDVNMCRTCESPETVTGPHLAGDINTKVVRGWHEWHAGANICVTRIFKMVV